ncbi:hypothetical protein MTO96_043508 [Rhipicephalus appendiculatus]
MTERLPALQPRSTGGRIPADLRRVGGDGGGDAVIKGHGVNCKDARRRTSALCAAAAAASIGLRGNTKPVLAAAEAAVPHHRRTKEP